MLIFNINISVKLFNNSFFESWNKNASNFEIANKIDPVIIVIIIAIASVNQKNRKLIFILS